MNNAANNDLLFLTTCLLALFAGNAFSQKPPSLDGYLCKACVDSVSAKQVAITYAAPLTCADNDVTNGQDEVDSKVPDCALRPVQVVLGNPDTKQVFNFLVECKAIPPHKVVASEAELDEEEMHLAKQLLILLENWNEALEPVSYSDLIKQGLSASEKPPE